MKKESDWLKKIKQKVRGGRRTKTTTSGKDKREKQAGKEGARSLSDRTNLMTIYDSAALVQFPHRLPVARTPFI